MTIMDAAQLADEPAARNSNRFPVNANGEVRFLSVLSQEDKPAGPSINKFVGDFIKTEVDNYLHKNPQVADVMLQKIQESEKERKAIAGVTKLARERAKKANLHNRKLRDPISHVNGIKDLSVTDGDA